MDEAQFGLVSLVFLQITIKAHQISPARVSEFLLTIQSWDDALPRGAPNVQLLFSTPVHHRSEMMIYNPEDSCGYTRI
jgi:hypothetical protein